jgi:hypothetical protein
MSHLSTERLAALGDEEPTAAEAVHLAACATCARERTAYRTLVAMAGHEREAIGIPLTRWDAIAGALSGEYPIVATVPGHATTARSGIARTPGRTVRFMRTPMRAAAGFLLLVGGAVAGRMSAGAPALPIGGGASVLSADAQGGGASTLVNRVPDSMNFASVEEARAAQLRSESLYQQAAAFLAEHDSTGNAAYDPEVVKSRLAALDQMISTTREAMRDAPHDPVINGYYLTTVNQREATLRQLNTVLPASLRSNSF